MNKFVKLALASVLPSMAATQAEAAEEAKSTASDTDKRPNVIFILMDDAGYGDFGCYGQTKIETPNIDALAANGIRFTDMYSAASLSSPSRCCLLTGVHTGHAQIRDNKECLPDSDPRTWNYDLAAMDPAAEGQAALAEGTPTLGTEMQRAGYRTGMVGKWGVGTPLKAAPWNMGFDFYYGCICQRMAHNYYPHHLWRNDRKEVINTSVTNPGTGLDEGADPYDRKSYDKFSKGKTYAPDKMYENVIGFVNENKDEPFFLMWTTPIPHSPLQAPQQWIDHYVKKFGDEEPLNGTYNPGRWPHNYYPCRYPHATFAAMYSYFDHQVGELVKELKRLGIYENTIIVVTSDNGPANNASSPTVWFDSAQPYRCGKGWGKRTFREGGIRMPFIVSWPAQIKEASVSDHLGCFTDVMPTLCELAGVDSPATDGISMLPLLKGDTANQGQHEYLYWEFPQAGGRFAVRWGKWKGIVENVNNGNRQMELYDISVAGKDIETPEMNVSAQHTDIVARMWKYIRESHTLAADNDFNVHIDPKIGLCPKNLK